MVVLSLNTLWWELIPCFQFIVYPFILSLFFTSSKQGAPLFIFTFEPFCQTLTFSLASLLFKLLWFPSLGHKDGFRFLKFEETSMGKIYLGYKEMPLIEDLHKAALPYFQIIKSQDCKLLACLLVNQIFSYRFFHCKKWLLDLPHNWVIEKGKSYLLLSH